MNEFALARRLAEVLETDPELSAWIGSKYPGRPFSTYLGMDNRVPPGESACPFAILFPDGKTAGDGVAEKEHVILMRLAVANGAVTKSGSRTSYAGIEDITSFADLAVAAIARNVFSLGLDWFRFEREFDHVNYFPMFVADFRFVFVQHVSVTDNQYD